MEKTTAGFLGAVKRAEKALREAAAVWTRKFINDLPNAAFAVVESGYKEGDNKSARHLPHHGKSVKKATEDSSVDLSHFRNALARANQIKSVLGKESTSSLRKKAAKHLAGHMTVLKKSKAIFSTKERELWKDCEIIFNENVRPLLAD